MSLKNKVMSKANALIKRSCWYNESLFLGCRKFWEHKTFNLDLINLGSSAAYYAFDYSEISLKCANFALPSQYLLADYEILKNYSSYLKPGATVIMGACLFSLDGYDVTYFDDRYYTILYPSSIWHFSMQRLRLVKDIKNNPIKSYPLMSFLYDVKNLIYKKKKEGIAKELFEKDAKRWIEDCWMKLFSIDDLDAPLSLRNKDLVEQATDIMNKIKNFCDEKDYNFVIVLPPVSPEMRIWLTPEMRKNYVYIFKNSDKLKDIQFVDYLFDSEFDSNDLYNNSYFLNEKGARQFTQKVLRDLRLI